MIFETFASGPVETNTYLVGCPVTKKCFIVDAPPECAERWVSFLKKEGLVLETIFLTHSHLDHIADVKALKAATGAKIFIHPLDAENLKKPGSDGLPLFIPCEGLSPDGFLQEGDVFEIGSIQMRVIFTPGHTPGGVSLYLEDKKILFSGDTLFKGTIGRIDFPSARPALMWTSLKSLSQLPPDTNVFSGHGPATQIGKETWLKEAKERFG